MTCGGAGRDDLRIFISTPFVGRTVPPRIMNSFLNETRSAWDERQLECDAERCMWTSSCVEVLAVEESPRASLTGQVRMEEEMNQ